MNNILELLKKDHKTVKGIFEKLENTSSKNAKDRLAIFKELQAELTLHEEIEENIFYPALKRHKETKDLILESFEEHHVVDVILQELEELEPKEESWMPKLTVLKENLNHHIQEEEEELFPKAEKVLKPDVLAEMGEEMQQMKEQKAK